MVLAINMPGLVLMMSRYWVLPAELDPWFKSHTFVPNFPQGYFAQNSVKMETLTGITHSGIWVNRTSHPQAGPSYLGDAGSLHES